jgi:hypothetical protein
VSQTCDQEMPGVGEMLSQKGDAVSSGFESPLRFTIGEPFEAVQQQIGIEIIECGEWPDLWLHRHLLVQRAVRRKIYRPLALYL